MSGRKRTIKLIISISIYVIIFVGVWVWIFFASRRSMINSGKSEAMYIAEDVENYLDKNIENLILSSKYIENMQSNNCTNEAILEYMSSQSLATSKVIAENFSGIYGWINSEYLDGMGYVPDADYVPTERPWYLGAKYKGNEPSLISPYIDSQTGRMVLSISKMLEDNDSVLSMDIYLDYIQQLSEEAYKNGNERLLIIDNKDVIVACDNQEYVGINLLDNPDNPYYSIIVDSKEDDTFTVKLDGENYIVYDLIITGDWHAVVLLKSSELLGMLRYVYFLAAIVVALEFSAVVLSLKSYFATKTEAEVDKLTGFLNRRCYEEYIEDPDVYEKDNLVCVMLDVNSLKETNDNKGHEAGDEIIIGAAQCIKKCFGSYGKVYRIGGDEFAAIIEANDEELSAILNDFDLCQTDWQGKMVEKISISYGYVKKSDYPESTIEYMMTVADQKMYEDKNKYYEKTGYVRRQH